MCPVALEGEFWMELAEVKAKVKIAIACFRSNDSGLLDFEELELPERPISHRLGFYLQPLFGGYVVDCEYNKHLQGRKIVDGKEFRPDIVVHNRMTDADNLLMVEVKARRNIVEAKADRAEVEDDYEKLKKFTKLDSDIRYKWGVSILILRDNTTTKWFENGIAI
jgi:hypothetical protein